MEEDPVELPETGTRRRVSGAEYRAVLFNAAKDGNLQRLQIFLENNDETFCDECLNIRDNSTDKISIVIAARNGNLDVVRYLLSKGADASVPGTVSFDGETIYSAPPLWAAAAAGHFDVVRCLVDEAKVDINQTTQTKSSPLRGACYDGHIDIVQFLIERGADVELANRHGHTPLMIASFRKNVEIVKYLLVYGANAHRASNRGNTALHDASEADCLEVVELLLARNVPLTDDDTGICPLLGAALMANKRVFPVLLEHCKSPLKKRDALRLLGCTYIDKKMDLDAGFDAWGRALQIDLEGDEMEKERSRWDKPRPAVFDAWTPAQTIDHLGAIIDDPDSIRMQSLMVREGILGGGHPDVHYYLRLRGAVYCDMGEVDRCFALWSYACQLQQKYLSPLHYSTLATLQAFIETFTITLNEVVVDAPRLIAIAPHKDVISIKFSHIHDVFSHVCYELERVGEAGLHDECTEEDHEHDVEDEKRRLAALGLQLLLVLQRMKLAQQQLNVKRETCELEVSRLWRGARGVGVALLHLSIAHPNFNSLEPVRGGNDSFPSLHCVERLLSVGGDPSERDSDGNSPLHLLLLGPRPRASIAKVLLEAGCLIHTRNKEGFTALQLIHTKQATLFKEIKIGKYMTLGGLAALAVKTSQIDYQKVLPTDIHDFVNMH